MTAQIIPILSPVERAWEQYVEDKRQADRTESMEDGRRAAQSWRRWLDLHMSEDQRAYLGGAE